MKASNLAVRLEDESMEKMEEGKLARSVLTSEANESLARRPRRSLGFQVRLYDRRAIGTSDQGLRPFRVR